MRNSIGSVLACSSMKAFTPRGVGFEETVVSRARYLQGFLGRRAQAQNPFARDRSLTVSSPRISDSSPPPKRRITSICHKLSCAVTYPCAKNKSFRFAASMTGTPWLSRVTVTAADKPSTFRRPSNWGRAARAHSTRTRIVMTASSNMAKAEPQQKARKGDVPERVRGTLPSCSWELRLYSTADCRLLKMNFIFKMMRWYSGSLPCPPCCRSGSTISPPLPPDGS